MVRKRQLSRLEFRKRLQLEYLDHIIAGRDHFRRIAAQATGNGLAGSQEQMPGRFVAFGLITLLVHIR